MIYKYCAESLLFKKVKLKTIFLSLLSLILLFFLVGKASYYIGINSKTELKEMTRYERVLLINENDTFDMVLNENGVGLGYFLLVPVLLLGIYLYRNAPPKKK